MPGFLQLGVMSPTAFSYKKIYVNYVNIVNRVRAMRGVPTPQGLY